VGLEHLGLEKVVSLEKVGLEHLGLEQFLGLEKVVSLEQVMKL
jgi:hypothetical protein